MSRTRKQSKNRTNHNPTGEEEEEPQQSKSWINLAAEDQPKVAVPTGPLFQVDLPQYTGPPSRDLEGMITEKLLFDQTWPLQDNLNIKEDNKRKRLSNEIKPQRTGDGLLKICKCSSPGSINCTEYHINEERLKLKTELGAAYKKWKFDEMGNAVSESWNKKDQETFDSIVKENQIFQQGGGFMNPALKSLPSKSRASIVSYYLNVYVPRRISRQTRSGCREIDTDNDVDDVDDVDGEEEGESNMKTISPAKASVPNPRRRSSYLSGYR